MRRAAVPSPRNPRHAKPWLIEAVPPRSSALRCRCLSLRRHAMPMLCNPLPTRCSGSQRRAAAMRTVAPPSHPSRRHCSPTLGRRGAAGALRARCHRSRPSLRHRMAVSCHAHALLCDAAVLLSWAMPSPRSALPSPSHAMPLLSGPLPLPCFGALCPCIPWRGCAAAERRVAPRCRGCAELSH